MAGPVTSCCFVLHKNHLHVTSIGSVGQWIKHLTKDLEIDGLSLTGVKNFQIWTFKLPTFGYKTLKR